ERSYVQDLPTPGRSFTALMALAPNISSFPQGNTTAHVSVGVNDTSGATKILPGGGGDPGYFMNGVNINDNYNLDISYQPSMEAISEVRVDVAGFSAANGRDIVTTNIQTKGGANQLHS